MEFARTGHIWIALPMLIFAACAPIEPVHSADAGSSSDSGAIDPGGEEDAGLPLEPTSGTIGPEGGRLSFGAYTLIVPPGGLGEPTEITIAPAVRDVGFGRTEAIQFGPAGLTFDAPFTVEYRGQAPADGEDVGFLWESSDGSLEALSPSALSMGDGSLRWTVQNDHFSWMWRFVGFVGDALLWYLRGAAIVGLSLYYAADRALEIASGAVGALGRVAECGLAGFGFADGQVCCPLALPGSSSLQGVCFRPDQECTAEGGTAVCRPACGDHSQGCCLSGDACGTGTKFQLSCTDAHGDLLSEPVYDEGGVLVRGTCEACGVPGAECCPSGVACTSTDPEYTASCQGELCCVDSSCSSGDEVCRDLTHLGRGIVPSYCRQEDHGCGPVWVWAPMGAPRCEASSLVDPETRRCCGV